MTKYYLKKYAIMIGFLALVMLSLEFSTEKFWEWSTLGLIISGVWLSHIIDRAYPNKTLKGKA